MKLRYVCAMLLLAALALLQTRVAFADCVGGAGQASEMACCQVSGDMLDATDAPLTRVCVDQCARPFAVHEPNQKVFVTLVETPKWAAHRPVAHPAAISKVSLRQFLAGPRIEGCHLLLHRLQRLLI